MKTVIMKAVSVLLVLIVVFGYAPSVCALAAENEPDSLGSDAGAQIIKPVNRYLSEHSVLSYRYSENDDYYYCDPDNSWQERFGYTRLYDVVAPYLFMEYDYIRAHFNYAGKDWLIQFWKGQYGLAFFGSEIGIYNKAESNEEDSYFTHYKCPDDSDKIVMQTNLYHKNYTTNEFEHQFSTPRVKTWWSTGFKPGHLVVEEPAHELWLTGSLEFKDEEMTEAFAEALKGCGIPRVENGENMPRDSFYTDGTTVYFSWQNISEAENTMVIKTTTGTLLFLNASALFLIIGFAIVSMMGMLFLLIII